MVTKEVTKEVTKKDVKDVDLDEGKITREEFERAMSSQESPKDATKDKAGKPKDIKTDSTKTVVKKAPAQEDAKDADLHDEETAKTLGKAAGKAEDDDMRAYEKFLSWKAGERRLRDEERKIKFRAVLKEKEREVKVQASLKDEERKTHLQALREMERRGKIEDARSFRQHLKIKEHDEDEIEQEEKMYKFKKN